MLSVKKRPPISPGPLNCRTPVKSTTTFTKNRSSTDSRTLAAPSSGAQCQRSRLRILYVKYRAMSLTRYKSTHWPPTIASSAMLTLLTRSSSAPLTIMHPKMSVLEDAASGM
jgi:hypothetical protein